MLAFLWWLIIGLLAGGLARFFVPGQQPMGCLATMILGIVGSFVGGFLSSLIFGYRADEAGFHTSGLIMSTIGAILALVVYLRMGRRA